ncbi:hypothetical protein AYL99_03767 [Fonsecaea erecta]|uniref:Uncharacterized protein n=1 Tax=Fonsecaea erecta TaxID=1367422 RepID=A0A178ZP11_9EURO|nr:hypothetical protein AYL99_03767 [Fonsecaea erecta]OAP61564.1 hypothetical protein AYL99_03767 [Fonsecaea erecta]
MAQAWDPAAYVHEGLWTNFTKGGIRGLTLTLCPKNAALLTSSLTLFITLSGGQLWTIIRFTLHQLQALPKPKDSRELHNQQQLILRNATTDLATMRLLLNLVWAYRWGKRKGSSRSIQIASLALIHAIIFMVAGAFSSTFLNAGPSVLSRSDRCGVWDEAYYEIAAAHNVNPTSAENFSLSVQYIIKQEHDVQLSLEYAQKCYLTTPPYYMASTCNTIQKPSLAFSNYTSECPFQPQLCHNKSDSIVFDTGIINSHDDLGINAHPEDRLTYQRITTCAVLNSTGYMSGWDGSNDSTDEPAYAYFGSSAEGNYTYSYSNFASLYTDYTPKVTVAYQLYAALAYGPVPEAQSPSQGDFEPLPELKNNSADVILFFLSYTGRYVEAIEDPWFLANRLHLVESDFPLVRSQYSRDSPISTLGCTEQHKFCTNSGKCTPFLGFDQVQHVDAFNFALTAHQNVTFDRMLRAVTASSLRQIVHFLALTSTPLLAMNSNGVQSHTLSLKLPNNQWQLELNYWHSIAMAQLQRIIVEWGTGQIAPEPQFLIRPQTEPDAWFCKNLMIPSTVYQSFSLLAIILTLTLGSLVILISLTIENCLGWAQGRFSRGLARREYWNRDNMLRLQSWFNESPTMPQPPPKDFKPNTWHHKTPESLELGSLPPVRDLHKDINSDADSGNDSPYQAPQRDICGPPSFNNRIKSPESTPRRSSDIFPNPIRDSWMTISLDGSDAAVPEAPVNVLDRNVNARTDSEPMIVTGCSRPAQLVTGHLGYVVAEAQSIWI